MRKFTLSLFGSILGVIGVALPWVTVSVGRLSRSVSGYDTKHGTLFIVALAIVGLVCAIMRSKDVRNLISLGVVLVAGIGLAIIAYNDIHTLHQGVKMAQRMLKGPVKVELGSGVWVLTAGLAIVILGALYDIFALVTLKISDQESPSNIRHATTGFNSGTTTAPTFSSTPAPKFPLERPPEPSGELSIPLTIGSSSSPEGSNQRVHKTCPDCGTPVDQDQPFCPSCAAPID